MSRSEPVVVRPWGSYEVLAEEAHSKVKYLTVAPHQRLSYQSHAHRAEHWTIIKGTAEVTIDGHHHLLGPGQSIDVPLGARHRVANPGEEDLVFVEVQLGDYFGEDDIVRYEDDFGRTG